MRKSIIERIKSQKNTKIFVVAIVVAIVVLVGSLVNNQIVKSQKNSQGSLEESKQEQRGVKETNVDFIEEVEENSVDGIEDQPTKMENVEVNNTSEEIEVPTNNTVISEPVPKCTQEEISIYENNLVTILSNIQVYEDGMAMYEPSICYSEYLACKEDYRQNNCEYLDPITCEEYAEQSCGSQLDFCDESYDYYFTLRDEQLLLYQQSEQDLANCN